MSGAAVLGPVLVTVIVVAFHTIIRTYLLCCEQVWRVAGIWLVALLLNIAMNAYLIPRYALWGAAMATLISGLAAMAGTLLAARHSGLRVDRGTWVVSLLPLLLLLPTATMLASLTLVGYLVWATELILLPDEKQQLTAWVAQRLRRLIPARASTT